ncbi:MAG: hypothetical protein IAI50_06285 [Candidatus Eremiobacteraeota bacterium]|nr:hypothetical protein [Candidatus Eremiobacteraeota bacterium]
MQRTTGLEKEIAELRSFAGRRVRIRLCDATEHAGTLHTDLLTAHSIAVFLDRGDEEGATIYIEEIVAVWEIF